MLSRRTLLHRITYGPQSGVGRAVAALPTGTRRLDLVGLSAGTLAACARPADYLHFYEIDPEIRRLATSCFTYLSNCPAKVELTLGDARLSLERQPPQQFDLLALDAFSSDAIPVHLLTTEAFEIYDRHLQRGGVIAVHISNLWLDFEPVLASLARHSGHRLAIIDHVPAPDQWWLRRSVWALLTPNDQLLASPALRDSARPPAANSANVGLWTDDFSSVFGILRR